ncbi:mechanosensitive ion channel domain-containing protein [Hutsoniella sourekii]
MNQISDMVVSSVEDSSVFLRQVLVTVIIVIAAILVSKLSHYVLPKLIDKDKILRRIFQVERVVLMVLTLAFTFNLWFSHTQSIGIILGVLATLAGLALKDMIVDVVAYVYVSFRHPFEMEDIIQVDGVVGQVVDMDFLQFNVAEMGHLVDSLTPTGRYVSMPNRFIFDKALFNYTRSTPFVMQEVYILIGFDADRELAMKLAGKLAYEKYDQFKQAYSEEELEKFDRSIEAQDYDIKPSIRAVLDSNGFRIYIQYFSRFDEIGKNQMIMQNNLYDLFESHNISMPEPIYYRQEA